MKKSKFIRSSIYLLIGGFLTKVLGMVAKIVLTRKMGTMAMGLYSLLMPTFSLFLSISGMGLSTALNVLIASGKYATKNLLSTSLFLGLTMDFLLLLVLFFGKEILANNFLHEPILVYPLLSIGFVLPFITVSNIFRSYFFAKERMIPHVFSNVLEDVIKLFLTYFGISYFLDSYEKSLTFLMMINIACEFSSILIFLVCFPKFRCSKKELLPTKKSLQAILPIAIPTTLSRLVGSITYFLEPIILTTILLKLGYQKGFIIEQYGIITSYVLPVLMLPSFFTNAISQALLPILSRHYHHQERKSFQKKLKQAIFLSLGIGILYTIFCFFFHQEIFFFLYHTQEGKGYFFFLLPIFLLYYLEGPLSSALQAMGKANIQLRISLINFGIRTLGLILLTSLSIGFYGFLIALSINIFVAVGYASKKVLDSLQEKKSII